MRARTAALITIVLAACAALAAGPVSAATPGYCRGTAPLDVSQLPERIRLAGCDIVGRTIVAGGLKVTVPPPGRGATIHALKTNGESSLTVRTTPDGEVQLTSEISRTVVSAAAASNDMIQAAQVVDTPTSFEWSRTGTTVDATVQGQDATADASCVIPSDQAPDRTVWYRYRAKHSGFVNVVPTNVSPADADIRVDIFQDNVNYMTACGSTPAYVSQGSVYFVRVGTRGTPASFLLRWFPPRPNADMFAKAPVKKIPSQTFTPNMFGARLEAGEPKPSCKSTWTGTIWQKVDAGTLRRIRVNTSGGQLAIYRGSTLGGLTQIACISNAWGKLVILPLSGPFYIQQWVNPTVEEAQLYVDSGEAVPEALPPCSDRARSVDYVLPRKPFRWRFNGANVPASLGTAALPAIRQGISVITGAKNDCGMPDRVSAVHEYLGRSTRSASMCATSTNDGLNVIDFGPASTYGVLGLACSYQTSTDGVDWSTTETDIRMTKNEPWTVKPDAPNCSWSYDLVGVAAHEAGHTFGLLHPYDFGNLTMAAVSSGCTGSFRTLGRGDVLGLEALY